MNDLLKSEIGKKSDAQKYGGNPTSDIRDHRQNLTVCITDGHSGHVLEDNV